MTYNRFVQGLKASGLEVDRKVLADLAVTDPTAFAALVRTAQAALPARRVRRLRLEHRPRRRAAPPGRRGVAGRRRARASATGARSAGRTLVSEFTGADAPGRRGPQAHPPGRPGRRGPVPRRGPAGGPGGAGRPDPPRELFVTAAAAARHPSSSTPPGPGPSGHRGDRAGPRPALSETATPQGLVAVCPVLDVPLGDGAGRTRAPRRGAADVRDPGNAGTVLRTADAAGADAVVLAGASVDPYNGKAVRAAAGSLFHLPVVRGAPLADARGGPRRRLPCSPPTGPASATGRDCRSSPVPPPGCSATRPGGCRPGPARSPTPGSASRSSPGPRA